MGKRHRHLRLLQKNLVREAAQLHGVKLPPREIKKIARDPGYKETEYGELRSTIRKLTENEIIERLTWKATREIQQIEDERVFAELERAMAPV